MRWRRLILGTGTVALLAILAVWTWLVLPRPGAGITRENYALIQDGMSQAEVEVIVGISPGDYHDPEAVGMILDPMGGGTLMAADFYRMEMWWGDKGMLHVGFDGSGRVAFKYFADNQRTTQSPWDRLRRLFR